MESTITMVFYEMYFSTFDLINARVIFSLTESKFPIFESINYPYNLRFY
jgi:hypothetical protein